MQAFTGPALNKDLKKKSVVIIAGGPSLTREDVELAEKSGCAIIGINNAYQMTDKLDILYGCDSKWWQHHLSWVPGNVDKYSLKKDKKDEGVGGVKQMERGGRKGLSRVWPVLNTGGNSGYQAINLAYLLGYKTIILLGYDMQNTGGQTHWHGDHNFGGSTNPVRNTFDNWRKDFRELGKAIKEINDVEIINATRQTALKCFPQMSLEDALCETDQQ